LVVVAIVANALQQFTGISSFFFPATEKRTLVEGLVRNKFSPIQRPTVCADDGFAFFNIRFPPCLNSYGQKKENKITVNL
jgi:hypothetical protein